MMPLRRQLIDATLQAWNAESVEELPQDVRHSLEHTLTQYDRVQHVGDDLCNAQVMRISQAWGNVSPKQSPKKQKTPQQKKNSIRSLLKVLTEVFGDKLIQDIKQKRGKSERQDE